MHSSVAQMLKINKHYFIWVHTRSYYLTSFFSFLFSFSLPFSFLPVASSSLFTLFTSPTLPSNFSLFLHLIDPSHLPSFDPTPTLTLFILRPSLSMAFVVGNGVRHKLLCSTCIANLVEFVWLVVVWLWNGWWLLCEMGV